MSKRVKKFTTYITDDFHLGISKVTGSFEDIQKEDTAWVLMYWLKCKAIEARAEIINRINLCEPYLIPNMLEEADAIVEKYGKEK